MMSATVVLTRPRGRNEALAQRITAVGLSTLVIPALQIQTLASLVSPVPEPDSYDLVVFVSRAAATFYLDALAVQQPGVAWPAHTLAATVGASSAEPLRSGAAIPPANILYPCPPRQTPDSEGLWAILQTRMEGIKRVLIVRGQAGREWLGARLEQAGAVVSRLGIYQRVPAQWQALQECSLRTALTSDQPCVFLLTSAQSVDAVHANIRQLELEAAWSRSRFVVIHERIASRLQSVLNRSVDAQPATIMLCTPSDDSIFHAAVSAASF